jgi:hypothetical protein
VLHTMSPNAFGHEHMSDRAQILLWQHRAFNCLPGHVRALDVAGSDDRLVMWSGLASRVVETL